MAIQTLKCSILRCTYIFISFDFIKSHMRIVLCQFAGQQYKSQKIMGSFRSQPDTNKHTYEMHSLDHSYAVTHMCGWRKYMEDASMIISPFTYRNYSLFGIFDGHGGPEVALFVQKHFPEILKENQSFKVGKFEQALKQSFLNVDRLVASQDGLKQIQQIKKQQIAKSNTSQQSSIKRIGCTALVVLVTKQHIFIANAGDCRAILGVYSNSVAKQVTKDHKPFDQDQKARIEKAGGYVQNGRVNGCLNLSRAIGDLQFKQNKNIILQQQKITSLPDIVKLPREDIHFLFLCCDGVWECKSSQDIGKFVVKYLEQRVSLSKILQNLLQQIVAKDVKDEHGTDNMSALLIKFDKLTPAVTPLQPISGLKSYNSSYFTDTDYTIKLSSRFSAQQEHEKKDSHLIYQKQKQKQDRSFGKKHQRIYEKPDRSFDKYDRHDKYQKYSYQHQRQHQEKDKKGQHSGDHHAHDHDTNRQIDRIKKHRQERLDRLEKYGKYDKYDTLLKKY